MPFAPGQSGNPEGRRLNKPFLDALQRAIKQDDAKRLRDCAETLLDLAAAGESWAVQMLADRLDGKAVQRAEVTGEDGGPIFIKTGIDRAISEAVSADR
jgi:hypothetical protein